MEESMLSRFAIAGVVIASWMIPTTAQAQLSYGGQPPSKTVTLPAPPTVSMPYVDVTTLLREDAQAAKGAFRFGETLPVNLGLDNSGAWDTLQDGSKVWRLRIESLDALSMNLVFSEYTLEDGVELYVYNDDYFTVLGSFNALNNKANGEFAVYPVKGEAVNLELHVPAWAGDSTKLRVGEVIHGYKDVLQLMDQRMAQRFPGIQFGNCEIDVACAAGNGWEDQIRAVALIIAGGSLCTGSLLNNTANDGTQYFNTANHCGNMNNAVFRFNYQRSGCGTGSAPTNNTVQGSTLVATNSGADYLYVRSTENIPASYGVYYAGWNRSGSTPPNTTTIHHPNGGVKKISKDNNAPQKQNPYWRIIQWDLGVTEPGSSGCPLYDNNKRFIGQLCCGQATCSFVFNDYYGRMDLAWNAVSSALDPLGTNPQFIDGFDPNVQQNCGSDHTYGFGCSGSLSISPALAIDGCYTAGGNVQLDISLGLGGSTAFLLIGLNEVALPMGAGCTLNVSPLLPAIIGPLPLSGFFPGQGAATLNAALPANATPGTVKIQAFVNDSGAALGFSNTNGVSMTVQ